MPPKSVFEGLSLLREKDNVKKGPTEGDLKLQQYLKRYTDGGTTDEPKKKKKKKVKSLGGALPAVRIVDQDVSGFQALQSKPAKALYEDEEEEDDTPVVVNEDAGRIMQQQLEKAKNYYGTGEDGSGWIAANASAAANRNVPAHRAHDDSPDSSRPHRARHDSPNASPPRRPRHDSPDASPPRRARHDTPDASPPRRSRHDTPDASPPRRSQYDSQDASPPRRQHHDTPDASPPRRRQHDTPDASPPRRSRHDSPDASPPRRLQNVGPDVSPPRRQQHDTPDASPPRRSRHDSPDASPPRRTRHDSPDASPPRKPQHHGGDVSPPRKRAATGPPDEAGSRHEKDAKRMADGTAAGLVSREVAEAEAQKLREEAEARRLRAQGRGEQTVVRDKATGKILTAEELAQREREKKQKEQEQQHLEWKGGLAQKRAAQERNREMQSEGAKPFARLNMDESAEEALRERERWGDPMAHLVRKKRDPLEEHNDLTNKYDAATLKKSGFIVPQEIPPHSWIRRRLHAPHNRYGIKPGRHWDGVDRSNGREKQLMMTRNELRVREQEAYEWATADM